MNGSVAGHPTPALEPIEIWPDPDEENPKELVLDPSELGEPLPPLDPPEPPAPDGPEDAAE